MKILFALSILLLSFSQAWASADSSIQGTYRAVLLHDPLDVNAPAYHQFATITLRTVNTGGNLEISANVRVIFGDWGSNEFLPYDYPQVPMNLLTRQISIRSENMDVSFVGAFMNDGRIQGEWYAASIGRVGTFVASKIDVPTVPKDSLLVTSLTGHYKGEVENTNPASNLPERMTMSLVTTGTGMSMKISGNVRFYLGSFTSNEYVETAVSDAQFNFYTRYLTVKTQQYGITLKGVVNNSGNFVAEVFADGLGAVGKVNLQVIQ